MDTLSDDPATLNNDGVDLAAKGYADMAITHYRRAITLLPGEAIFYANLANAFLSRGDWDDAISAYERAISLGTDIREANRCIGLAWAYKGNLDLALRHLDISGDEVSKGIVLLAYGELKAGWPYFEGRLVKSKLHRDTPPPYWNGESLKGKIIYVWPEHNTLDDVLFAGMLPDLVSQAGFAIIECRPSTKTLFQRSFPKALIVARPQDQTPLSISDRCHYQIPLMSLGRFFRPDFQSFPRHSGYLQADPKSIETLRNKYTTLARGRRIIGLQWRGKHDRLSQNKSATLTDWQPIIQTPGLFFVNLETQNYEHELNRVAAELGVTIYSDDNIELPVLDNYFSHIASMDLVISTSGTATHAAGSQNIPCWLILPRGPAAFWYWHHEREDSPWYPSVKIFRQTTFGQNWWEGPVKNAAAFLQFR